jgi:hypothetical protein
MRLVALLLACSVAQAAPLDRCIQIARSEEAVSFSNACSQTVHLDFEITGGMDYRSRPCRAHKGTYSFAAHEQAVDLPISTCSVRYWVCDTETRNRNGGKCRRP